MNHLKLLRRCIVEKQTGTFRYAEGATVRTFGMVQGEVVASEQDVAGVLGPFLLHGAGATFSPSAAGVQATEAADRAISLALAQWHIPAAYRSEMRQFFETFPRVKVKLVPVHRFGFPHPLAF